MNVIEYPSELSRGNNQSRHKKERYDGSRGLLESDKIASKSSWRGNNTSLELPQGDQA